MKTENKYMQNVVGKILPNTYIMKYSHLMAFCYLNSGNRNVYHLFQSIRKIKMKSRLKPQGKRQILALIQTYQLRTCIINEVCTIRAGAVEVI